MTSDVPITIEVAEVDSPPVHQDASAQLPLSFHSPQPPSPSPSRQYAMGDQDKSGLDPAAASNSLGLLSFAPATRTTVVTTTTTTTTAFPPLLIKPPRATQDLDPKLYPLASSPTPSSLKNIQFTLGGKSIVFKEPEDTTSSLNEVCSEYNPHCLCTMRAVSLHAIFMVTLTYDQTAQREEQRAEGLERLSAVGHVIQFG